MKRTGLPPYFFWSGIIMLFLSFWIREYGGSFRASGILCVVLATCMAMVEVLAEREKREKKN